MAYKRKATRAVPRPRKRIRRMEKVMLRRPRMPRDTMINVKRTFNYGYWQPSTATTSDFWKYYAFRYQDLPSYAEFSAIFDQYKLNRIKVTFRPRFNSFDGANTTDTTLPGVTNQAGTNLHIINDPLSDVNPSGTYTRANMNGFLENGSVRTYNGNRAVSVYYKPVTYEQWDNVLLGAKKNPGWLQTSANPQFYGFHAFAQDVNMSGTFGQSWDVFVTFYIQYRNLK